MNKHQKDYSNYPYVANYRELYDWLHQTEARCMWQQAIGEDSRNDYPRAYVECYMLPANGRTFIVVVHAEKHGWELFTPCGSNGVEATLNDADIRLGLK